MGFDEQYLQKVREDRILIDRYDDWLFDEYKPFLGQRILEIGCGLGNILSRLTDRQLVIGTETSEEVVKETSQRFKGHQNIRILVKDITKPEIFELEALKIDTIISLNVFEHVEDDHMALRNSFRLLQSTGCLILIVPAHQFLYGVIDRSIGHYRRYTKSSLYEKLELAGYIVNKQKYINGLGALGWWLNSRVLFRKTPPEAQLKVFNSIVPGLRFLENITGAPFGISLISISQKP